jgi:mono/diheme cytochrome c family protein
MMRSERPCLFRACTERRFHAVAAIALATAVSVQLAGCGDAGGPVEVTKAEPGTIPATPQRPGDPQAGYDALVNRTAVTCGLPYRAYAESTGSPAPAYELPGRRGRNAELPYGLTAFTGASGVEVVTSNCLGCHAAPLNGELVIGLGNEFLDFTGDPIMAVEAAGAYVETDAEAAEWQRWADRISAIAPWSMTDTIGANPAIAITLVLMAHRDPETLAWSDEPLIAPPPTEINPPVSVPPWWNMGKKHAMFYNGEGRVDHVRYMMLASTTCTDSVEEARAIDAWFTDVRAYLATLEPPAYPYPIDAELAAAGEQLFKSECKECHGRYGQLGSDTKGSEHYPNKLIALDEVGTDPIVAEKAYYDSDRFIRWFNGSFYGEGSSSQPGLGYVAPPLDGVWATAPYFHNGSVPTLAAVLDTAARPTYWRLDGAEPVYDTEALGWSYRTLAQGREQFASLDEQKWVYDTTRTGYGNQGHDFGDILDAQERRALLEYLKTL